VTRLALSLMARPHAHARTHTLYVGQVVLKGNVALAGKDCMRQNAVHRTQERRSGGAPRHTGDIIAAPCVGVFEL